MHSIPVGSVLLILFVDLAIIELLSIFIGLVVARSASKPIPVGVLLGALVPLIGPLIWMVVVVGKDTSLAGVTRTQTRGLGLYGGAGLLAASALLFLVATPIPWGSVSGSIQEYSLVGESSAADTGVGLLAIVGSAAILVVGLVAVLLFTVRRRVAIVAAMVGAAWLIVTVDGLISFSAVNHLSRTIDGLSAGQAAAEVAPRGGLYVSLFASMCAVAGAIVLGLIRREGAPAGAAASTTPALTPSGAFHASPYLPPPIPSDTAANPVRDEF